MRICFTKKESFDTVLYVTRPTIESAIYDRFISEFNAVPNSEYERLVIRLADLILNCGEDLSLTYQHLFSEEYPSFSDYLEFECDIDQDCVNRFLSTCVEGESLWKINIADYETYNFMTLFDNKTWENKSILETINIALERCKE